MSTERDTHFQGFAELQYLELAPLFKLLHYTQIEHMTRHTAEGERLIKQLLARFAYDLAMHVLSTIDPLALQATVSDDQIIKDIPDLTEWPEETEKQ